MSASTKTESFLTKDDDSLSEKEAQNQIIAELIRQLVQEHQKYSALKLQVTKLEQVISSQEAVIQYQDNIIKDLQSEYPDESV